MPKKPDERADRKPEADQQRQQPLALARSSCTSALPRATARPQHQQADDDHQHAEQQQQAVAVDHLAELGAAGRPDHAGDREHHRAWPLHRARTGVADQVGGGAGRHRDRAGADRDMGRGHADHVDHQRHGQDRAAAADQPEREADEAAGDDRQDVRQSGMIGPGCAVRRDVIGRGCARLTRRAGSTASARTAAPCRRSR